ncbi:DUF2000 family protein [Candidatus Paracaedibacter symbiosus]|uniref:DUF2000 family protein n=1 Tax=Candidatus Paracaedibacter symbiosus TaxID=244582 RepID=UPI000509D61D|nr:DUF2000 family protein [Candidatus Paracaedibacter symbiosus]
MGYSLFFTPAESADMEEDIFLPQNRSYVIVNDKLEFSQQVSHINKVARDIGFRVGSHNLAQLPYIDKDGNSYKYISAFPCIIMKSKPSSLEAFSNTKVEGVDIISLALDEEKNKTPTVAAAFGPFENLRASTKKFSVYRPTNLAPSHFDEFLENTADEAIGCIAVVDKELEAGKQLNALAHMAIGIGSVYQEVDELATSFSPTFDVVATATNQQICEAHRYLSTYDTPDLRVASFLDTMHLGPSYKEQIAATAARKTADLKITGLYAVGPAHICRVIINFLK